MTPELEAEFRDYVAARRESLHRMAYLLCGDWHRAEDAVQTSLVKLYAAWNRTRRETAGAYVRRIITNTLIDDSRRGWFRRERVTLAPPESPVETGHDDRLTALSALSALPPRQRAVLVLRFWEDLSVVETARILRCSTGNVKSQTARGLEALRRRYTSESLTGAVR
ncbi:RNA polymerase sigma-70 factor (sigma-E family) [Stackebrandtia albiflava]|uniref:RNA polymerase sigma-70 factor (Sigma-E family) n=1 Tax=Stackebrandtia albiflava TaxID=406432 RepID=A0A562VA05_9ACTN|nr:SigE family RNA polymerase sigma factor [Stackebrandtia albiflava]TWJ14702.1 RNA polymerase sigma-70 factor (sigma-E family) [Stackebrandtia albiflava]